MEELREYGNPPFYVAVVHGGPGAPGEMAPVARELSSTRGVLEPLQTAASIEGQVRELHAVLCGNGSLPITLVGWSWGAWLSFIFAAGFQAIVRKLVLIGSGPFEDRYAPAIMRTRLNRLGEEERAEASSLMKTLGDPSTGDKDSTLLRLGELLSRADSFDPLPHGNEVMECRYEVYQNVWGQASELRSGGRLLEMGAGIQCPVVAIHGDYDPHPPEGVEGPLSRVLKDFRFILLENCGHYPWFEREARGEFFEVLHKELA